MFMLALVGLAGTLYLYSVALDYTSAALASAAINSIPDGEGEGKEALRDREALRSRTVHCRRFDHSFLQRTSFEPLESPSRPYGWESSSGSSSSLQQMGLGDLPHDRLQPDMVTVALSLSLSLRRVLYLILNLTQEPLLKQYPSELMFTTLQSLFSAIQTFFITLAIERDFSRWKLSLDMGLISVAYCGVVVTGLAFFLQSWTIQRRGLVFLALSAPLTMIIIMMLSPFLPGVFVDLGRYAFVCNCSGNTTHCRPPCNGDDILLQRPWWNSHGWGPLQRPVGKEKGAERGRKPQQRKIPKYAWRRKKWHHQEKFDEHDSGIVDMHRICDNVPLAKQHNLLSVIITLRPLTIESTWLDSVLKV
ncbi:WAT1-related protein At5g64700-like isoform X2 [Musa acuminata AAA Group]|uniref:WAT1-related protein At5g64700-like isoform X2 n=1 Tax=Musa acuminata AAA Group TaxID=214697 RepID=UPI0031D0DC42